MFFSQILGGAIFISVGQNVLNNQLLQRLTGLPGFSPSLIETGGATSLINSFPVEYRHDVLVAYNESLRVVFRAGLILAALSVLGALAMEWRSVKKQQPGSKSDTDVEKSAADTTEGKSDGENPAAEYAHQGGERPTSRSSAAIEKPVDSLSSHPEK